MRVPARIVAAVCALALLTVGVPPAAQAVPATGLCRMNTARGEVPQDFVVEACVDGSSIWIRNNLSVPITFGYEGSVASPTKVQLDQTIAAQLTRIIKTDPRTIMPGDLLRYPLGNGSGSVTAIDTSAGGMYALAFTLSTFVPKGVIVGALEAFAQFIKELDDVFRKYQQCLAGKNWLAQKACELTLLRDGAFAGARLGITVIAKGVLEVLLSAQSFLSWAKSQVPDVSTVLHGTRRLSQGPPVTAPTDSSANSSPPPPPPGKPGTTGPRPAPTTPPPGVSAGSAAVSRGGSAQGRPGCTSTACAYVDVSIANFASGSHTVVCRASGEEGGFYTYTMDGTSSSVCYYGFAGRQVWVTVDGIESNRVTW